MDSFKLVILFIISIVLLVPLVFHAIEVGAKLSISPNESYLFSTAFVSELNTFSGKMVLISLIVIAVSSLFLIHKWGRFMDSKQSATHVAYIASTSALKKNAREYFREMKIRGGSTKEIKSHLEEINCPSNIIDEILSEDYLSDENF